MMMMMMTQGTLCSYMKEQLLWHAMFLHEGAAAMAHYYMKEQLLLHAMFLHEGAAVMARCVLT